MSSFDTPPMRRYSSALSRRSILALGGGLAVPAWLAGCAAASAAPQGDQATAESGWNRNRQSSKTEIFRLVNRLTWGATQASCDRVKQLGVERYVDEQLHPRGTATMPDAAQSQIAALKIAQSSLPNLLWELDVMRKNGAAIASEEGRKTAQQAYQQELNRLAREAASRHLLRAVYSEQQLLEHMTWFWLNHFNVHMGKHNLRAMVGDYEEHAIRPHALGRFRDLLGAVTHHPAMLRYLDNDQNAAGRVNENYARELLELHTLGVDGGYHQGDVQELARVLTGFGVNFSDNKPNVKREWASLYVRNGGFEFNPNRHDFGDKVVLGHTIRGRGADEVEDVLDMLANHRSTARFVSRKLAQYLLADEPPLELVQRMAHAFENSGGQIAATLRVLLLAPEFLAEPAHGAGKFKDPLHFVVSAVRASYEDKVIANTSPMQNWLNRMGEGLYTRQTPDGYPLTAAAWTSAGQMSTRFEIARTIGNASAGLFKSDDPGQPMDTPAFPRPAGALYFDTIRSTLGADTRLALDQAASPQEWNTLFLSSPEFMYR